MKESLRILVVEDDSITAADIRETLEKAGHTVTATARSFVEALRSARKEPPDVALLDIRLAGSSFDGISTASELRKLHSMPVIYLTASSEYETFQRAKETLPAAYLLKPFRHAELALQVELAYFHHQVNRANANPLEQQTDFYLPINKGYERVAKNTIAFLQAEGAYVRVFLADTATSHLLSMNLGYLSQFFMTPNFYRLSRSVLINLDHLERLERNQVFMRNHPDPLPLPEASRADLMKKLTLVRTR